MSLAHPHEWSEESHRAAGTPFLESGGDYNELEAEGEEVQNYPYQTHP